jgi:hypothetical protein
MKINTDSAPKKSTTDAALAVKEFAQENLLQKKCVVMVSLDVRGAFDAAWWPSILHNLRNLRCPRNLYVLSHNYFSDRMASLQVNTHAVERTVTKGFPQGSCCAPGFWNIMYNGLLNLRLLKPHEGHSIHRRSSNHDRRP